MNRIFFRLAIIALTLLAPEVSMAGERRIVSVAGYEDDGAPSAHWLAATKPRHTPEDHEALARARKKTTPEEAAWQALIESVYPAFAERLSALDAPFPEVSPPETIRILFGNQGDNDGFTYGLDTICTDLSALAREYGLAEGEESKNRALRILSHEYTHLLTKQHLMKHPWKTDATYASVLWELYYEGLGNLYSLTLSEKWVAEDGELTVRARETLAGLEPVMLERLEGLSRNPEGEEAARLRANLSDGPFTKKWGALPVALWLAADTQYRPEKIQAWVAKGPGGVLELAARYAEPQRREAFAVLLRQAEDMRASE